MTSPSYEELESFLDTLSPEEEEKFLQEALAGQTCLLPQAGPQTMAMESEADVVLYGGAAGGGKTFLAIILALTKHRRALVIRKEAAQLYAMQDEVGEIMGSRDGFNSQTGIWRLPCTVITDPLKQGIDRQIRFGGLNKPGDAKKYMGAPRDILIIDEAANVSYEDYVYLTVWSRSTIPGQRVRVMLCTNPPTDSTGMWLINVFRPWLDSDHPNPAKPGELRYFINVDDNDMEVPTNEDVVIDGSTYSPQSRTFIPAKIDDNRFLVETGYKQNLQRLPKDLRSKMLDGNFMTSFSDDEFQVIPSDWVDAAQARWQPMEAPPTMDAMGVDPSRGGADEMVISARHGSWFAPLIKIPGVEVPNGPIAASHVIMHRRDAAPILLDVIGIGSSVFDKLEENDMDVTPLVGNEKTEEKDAKGLFKFRNKRALWWWRMREALDPESGNNIALPPDKQLKQDLCCFTYVVADGMIIKVESKKEAKVRLGRSPDSGDAVIYANSEAPSIHIKRKGSRRFGTKRAIGGRVRKYGRR